MKNLNQSHRQLQLVQAARLQRSNLQREAIPLLQTVILLIQPNHQEMNRVSLLQVY